MPYLKDRYLRTVEQTRDVIGRAVFTEAAPLNAVCWKTEEPLPYARRTEGTYMELSEGDKWGENTFDCAWFRFTGEIPAECEGKNTVLLLDLCGEGLVVDEAGQPVQGITCVDSNFDISLGKPGKRVVPFQEKGIPGTQVDVWVDAAANDLFGTMRNDGRLKTARIAVLDRRLWDLHYDLIVLCDYLKSADRETARFDQVLFTLYDACVKLTTDDLNEEGLTAIEEAAQRLLSAKGGDAPLTFTAVGHAHMDLAWLWPIRETKRKGARTFATALSLMDKYPGYVFGASQPQLLAWMKEDYPGLYERIKQKVREGRFEVQGCMWVEADTNVSGGEALVRQILYGKNFWMEEFGKDIRVLWLPDVFGYNAALPQILVKSGNDVFMTQKLSWSEHNKFPHQTFRWKGIDGTEIFTHMLPEETYNSPLMPRGIRFAEKNYHDKGICNEALILFGIGDGGGGPGPEHLEAGKRVTNLYGLMPVKMGQAQPMLERLREKTEKRVPLWQGELYLEKHQGTYTTSARNKKYNRKMEIALRDAEILSVMCGQDIRAELEPVWKETLLYQFHDILPGSSIQRVYTESQARYAFLTEQTESILRRMEGALPAGRKFVNTLSWPRTVVYEEDGTLYRLTVPAMGYTCRKGEEIISTVKAEGTTLENKFIKAVFGGDGSLVSCYDKVNDRETLSAPCGRFCVYREYNSDCWDIALEYTDRECEYFTLTEQSFSVEHGKAVCRQKFIYRDSTVETEVSLDEVNAYLRWDAKIDWQESDRMLRTSFDTAVITDKAGFDIQYGMIHRTNDENTTWDKAKFEVCGHKFADLSEGDWGVSLLNDCKYGFRVKGGTIDMNLLRSQHYPSDRTDRGEHTLSYALYPHAGNEKAGRVKEAAYEFNIPVRVSGERVFRQSRRPSFWSDDPDEFVTVEEVNLNERSFFSAEGVIIEAVKNAEDGKGLILRAYEPYGTHAKMRIALPEGKKITPCDLMEKPCGDAFTADVIEGEAKPFEILTWRLEK